MERRSVAVRRYALGGDPLAVEREHIAHRRDRVEERDREVVAVARGEARQRRMIAVRQGGDEGASELVPGSAAVRDRRQTGPVEDDPRHARPDARAAAAVVEPSAGSRRGARSLSTLHRQREHATLREARIVVEPRDLETAELELAGRERTRIGRALPLEGRHLDRLDAVDLGRGRVQPREVDRLAERELVGMEQPAPPVGLDGAAEPFEERLLDVGAEVLAPDADRHLDLERDVARRVHANVDAGHPIALEPTRDGGAEILLDGVVVAAQGSTVTNAVRQLPVQRNVAGRPLDPLVPLGHPARSRPR